MILPVLLLGAAALAISWLATAAMIRIAPRVGFVDRPGHRKIHAAPKPLGGGVAILLGFALPLLAAGTVATFALHAAPANSSEVSIGPFHIDRAYITGIIDQAPMAGAFLICTLALHVMGIIDDRRPLGPYVKLIVQLAAATILSANFKEMRALTTFGPAASIALTVLWITAITNAFNFLDNMDGLSAGVATVCAAAFFTAAIIVQQWFVAAALAALIGALAGFLFWNFPPARIFMGDSGSLVIGFVLGVLTVRTTYLRPGESFQAGWYAVFAPVIVLALPLYDLVVVSVIRLSRGKSPFRGDTNHFSHRLVARGMSRRTAVLCLYLVTAATSLAAILLPFVHSSFAATLIFAQTLLVLGVVALLEQHPLPPDSTSQGAAGPQ